MSTTLLQEGDLLNMDGARHIVTYVNDSRARLVPLEKEMIDVSTPDGGKVSFTRSGHAVNISTTIETSSILERTGLQGLREFLAAKASRRKKTGEAQQTTQEETDTDMGRKRKENTDPSTSTKPKARGGLAAQAAKAKEEADPAAKKSKAKTKKEKSTGRGGFARLDKIHGFGITSVIRRLGANGVTKEHAAAILAKAGIKAAPATIAININNGKAGEAKGKQAALTGDQLTELIDSAPDPTAKTE